MTIGGKDLRYIAIAIASVSSNRLDCVRQRIADERMRPSGAMFGDRYAGTPNLKASAGVRPAIATATLRPVELIELFDEDMLQRVYI